MTEGLDPGLPGGLPDENFLIQRMGMSDTVAVGARPFLATISASTLGAISRTTSIPMGVRTVLQEAVYYRGNNRYLIPRYWPVTQLLQVVAGAGAPLRIGSEFQVARGQAEVAITQPSVNPDLPGGETLTLAPGWWAPGTQFFVSYLAGMDTLPTDLLEVYVELAFLMWKEKDRVGLTRDRTDVGDIYFTRDLPKWAIRALRGYQRSVGFV